MAPKLYMSPTSPPVRAVLMTAKSIGLELDLQPVDRMVMPGPGGRDPKPNSLETNPQQAVPTLQEEDGFTVSDSHAIMAYLVGKYGKNDQLYPKDFRKRAVIDQRLHFECGVLFGEIRHHIKPIFLGKKNKVEESDVEVFYSVYDFLESFLENNAWLAGDSVTLADISIFATLSSIDLLIPVAAEKYPKLAAWMSRFAKLPEHEANVEGLIALGKLLKHILENPCS